jgi:hypothetical protein
MGARKVVWDMRRTEAGIILVVVAVSVAVLTGCVRQAGEGAILDGQAAASSSFSAGEPPKTETLDADEEPQAEERPDVTTASKSQQPISEAEEGESQGQNVNQSANANGTSSNGQTTGSGRGGGGTGSTGQPSSVTPSEPSSPGEPVAPLPAAPPAPKSAYDAPYDTATIVANARAYGEGIGMTWSGSLNKNNCSWEAPGTTSATLSGERLRSAIESGIQRVKKLQQSNGYGAGEFHFKVVLESAGGGEYAIYFLMG